MLTALSGGVGVTTGVEPGTIMAVTRVGAEVAVGVGAGHLPAGEKAEAAVMADTNRRCVPVPCQYQTVPPKTP